MSETSKKPKLKRRWLRFNLRSFLIVVTILIAWVGWYVYRAERQRSAVRWVRENGGDVSYQYELDQDGSYLTNPEPPGPKWLHEVLGVDYFECVVRVDLRSGAQVNDLAPLTGLKKLEELEIWSDQVNDLTPLASLTNLKFLTLLGTDQVSDLTPLAGLTKLIYLTIEDSRVSDLKPLAGLTKLEHLSIWTSQISDLTPLASLTNLEYMGLYFRNAQISDLSPLYGLTNLETLWLMNTEFGVVEIAKMRRSLPNCEINISPVFRH